MIEVVKFLIRAVFAVFYRVEITGMENIPKNGSALLCANHLSELDMFFIGYKIRRLIHWIAKAELFKNPILGAVLTWVKAVPIKRGKTDIALVKMVRKLLKEGHIVGIFPEGTRTRGKARSNITVKPAFVKYALETGAPILPTAIVGNFKLFSKVRVIFGKPFYLDNEPEKDKKYTKEELSEMSEKVMNSIYGLMEEK